MTWTIWRWKTLKFNFNEPCSHLSTFKMGRFGQLCPFCLIAFDVSSIFPITRKMEKIKLKKKTKMERKTKKNGKRTTKTIRIKYRTWEMAISISQPSKKGTLTKWKIKDVEEEQEEECSSILDVCSLK